MLSLITLLFKTIFSVVQRYRFKTWRFSNHKYKGIWVGLGLSMPERLEVRKSPFFFFLYVKDKIKLLILLRLWVRDWTDGDNNNEATWLRQWGKETETMTALNNPGWASSRSPGRIPSESRRHIFFWLPEGHPTLLVSWPHLGTSLYFLSSLCFWLILVWCYLASLTKTLFCSQKNKI